MQKPNQPVLTNAGRQMLNDVAGSKGKITYTRAVMYGQDLSSMTIDQLRDLTTINDSKLETKIGVSDIKLETVTIIASFSNATVMQDTTYSSIGWYASTTVDSAEKLIAVIPYQQPQTLIAGSNGKATASTDIQLLIHIGDDVNVELRPIEEGLISEAELKNALTLLSSKGLLYLGDEITDATYQADPKCFDKISNTSIKHINLENNYLVKGDNLLIASVRAGWILTIADGDSKRFQLLLDTDDNFEENAINSIFTRVLTTQDDGTFKCGNWTKILNRENLFGELPRYLYFYSSDNDNADTRLPGGIIRWNVDGDWGEGIALDLSGLVDLFGYDNNNFNKSNYEEIRAGLYEKLFINHAKLMEILAPYGKVKSVNGIAPDTTGNVDVLPQHFRFNNNEILNLPLAYDEDSKSVNLDISSLLSLISFNGGTVDPALYSSIDPELYDKLLISHKELNTKLASSGMVKSVNGTQPDPNGDVTLDIDTLTYKDNMSDSLLVSHAQLVEALRDKANKEDINNAPFVRTDSSTPVTLNPGVTSTGKTLIYKSPTGNPSDDVYLVTQNDLNQKADKSSVYSKSETYSKDEATKTFGKVKKVNGLSPDNEGNIQLPDERPHTLTVSDSDDPNERWGDPLNINYNNANVPHINLQALGNFFTSPLLDKYHRFVTADRLEGIANNGLDNITKTGIYKLDGVTSLTGLPNLNNSSNLDTNQSGVLVVIATDKLVIQTFYTYDKNYAPLIYKRIIPDPRPVIGDIKWYKVLMDTQGIDPI